jgi:hypothetical protein
MLLSPKQALRAAREIMALGSVPPHLQHAIADEDNLILMLNETCKHGWRLNDKVSERRVDKKPRLAMMK